ncbi:MAG TPA: hypothetical protein VN922_07165 [Bacteroidia bacterium]|nr:hypothetical protein [Bacteroidia bacterium]
MQKKVNYHLKITEIAERLEKGWTTSQITKEYTGKWGVSARTVDRYIAIAKDLATSRLKRRDRIIEAVRADIIAKESEDWLKSTLELEARLCAIISGKIEFKRKMKKGSETQTVLVTPSCMEVINAIDLLLKMRGMYRPVDQRGPIVDPIVNIVVDNEEQKKMIERMIANNNKEPKEAGNEEETL